MTANLLWAGRLCQVCDSKEALINSLDVIPAKAGIQYHIEFNALDFGFTLRPG